MVSKGTLCETRRQNTSPGRVPRGLTARDGRERWYHLACWKLKRKDMSVIRRWNLNEAEGRYAGTNIVESVIELHLGVKGNNGRIQKVGKFRLELNTLADQGFVTRRVVEGNRVFDVQIYLARRDLPVEPSSYSLGVREHSTTPIAPYAIGCFGSKPAVPRADAWARSAAGL
jgi:hypothetical protein